MPLLEIELQGPLLVAGTRSPALGVDAATARRFHEGRWVPVIPASALRGAIRVQLEALLLGAGRRATSPYPFDGEGDGAANRAQSLAPPAVPDDPVSRLFGYSARRGQRSGGDNGCLRFGDGLPIEPERAAAAFGVRPGVEIDDLTGAAADRKLYFREVADGSGGALRFVAKVDVESDAREDDLELLRRAAESTIAVGAAKASGGGRMRIRWREEADGSGAVEVAGAPEGARRGRLILRALEPLHFGEGGPIGNYHGTRFYIPGATLRGAVAWALLRAGRVKAEEAAFQRAFVDLDNALSFGDGLPVVAASDQPAVLPVTRRRCKSTGEVLDVLAAELARERVNRRIQLDGGAMHLRGEASERKVESLTPRPTMGLLHRVRTRVSIDRLTGTAAEQRLFSIEQVEPWAATPAGGAGHHATFISVIEGLDAATAELLGRLRGVELLVGGRSRHGFGRVAAKLELLPAEASELLLREAIERTERLGAEVERLEAEYTARTGVADVRKGVAAGEPLLPLALVATSEFVGRSAQDHPLAFFSPPGPEPVRRFVSPAKAGGYDQRPRDARRAGGEVGALKPLEPVVGAGSVYVYEVPRGGLEEWLRRVLAALRRGVGSRREAGFGRFAIFDWPLQAARASAQEEAMTTTGGLSIKLKNDLVSRATKIAGKARKDRQAASQLRNLVQISQTESEVLVLTNFIQYQAARSATSGFWGAIHEDVIRDLEWIAGEVQDDPSHRRVAFQHFFGYLVRAYVYEKRDQGSPNRPGGPQGRPVRQGDRR